MHRLLCLLALALTGCASLELQTDKRASLAFTDVNVVDVVRGRIVPHRNVIVDNGRIVWVGSTSAGRPQARQLVDGRGKYLIPGLWDMHVHLFRHNPRGQNDRNWFPLFVANGVTGVRDMFENLDDLPITAQWRRELAAGRVGPRIIAAGVLIDGEPPQWKGSLTVHTTDQARELVRAAKSHGADFIKAYDRLRPDLFRALGEQARQSRMGFAGHVPFSMRALEAAAAGLQSLEHMGLLDRDCSGSDRTIADWNALLKQPNGAFTRAIVNDFSPMRCTELAKSLARSGSWVEIDFVNRLAMTDQRWRSRELRRFVRPATWADWPPERAPDVEQRLLAKERVKAQVARTLIANGVPAFVGTDVGNPYLIPGFSLHDTLELLVNEAGLTPAQALRAATIAPARFMKMDRVQGSVEKGRNADLVLLSKNPLADIRHSRSIFAVVNRGRLLDRTQLDALLAAAENAARD